MEQSLCRWSLWGQIGGVGDCGRKMHAPTDEVRRAQMLCALPSCNRRLCKESERSRNFCCYMCEAGAFGRQPGAAHGNACSKKEKPPWDSQRAPLLPTPGWEPPPGEWSVPTQPDATCVRDPQPPRTKRAPRENPPPGVSEEIPRHLLWEVTSRVIKGENDLKMMDRFLARCYPIAIQAR